ncbi:DUF4150 domain-containing protein [Vibrio neptunius]|uniref:DUF4150 domain-containing protein n=1 Tax=Vibrio neptunius TaxID=170651 RepID=A0ABS2ZWP3_9VIBR|nr:DUF4150 domain-containing protein [Vibrio neptunius]MBN3492236.1 DUF4150 domain-containing protein [Vibrio neptunius]MBN3514733.1 DUF4150 domain-containing protein [Vibrio neptunius]MBN3552112.1 DUF4150 domain-containing protein [Vibrio neptunius]MBN3576666.1 DUF4150 domain-containing protein [Vibrio neptunius]MCH9870330.1 DUF4150 domain-containing protein [Vibrio neptunius]
MPVTINANGLSIVHKGSGGEANATLPDVCLTTVGPAVVPIPYGNNAKSADLVDGTTTVTADGGNSIALKSSKFAKSTGDAGGDKKGVASGTIESEAEFISASPNVIIEGKGVARLSDQMTMNKGNTMCLGGVQNPSVTVSEDEEGTYTVYVKARYPDGVLLKNADFDITDVSGAVLAPGHFPASGKSKVSGLKPGQIKILVKESTDEFIPKPVRITNPHYVSDYSDADFFDRSAGGQQTFWQPKRIAPPVEGWGFMGPSLTADRYFADIVKLEVKTHFKKHHPEFKFDDLTESIIAGIESMSDESMDSVISFGLPMMEAGEILSVLYRLPKHETADRMLAYMRARGKGNPQTYLKELDWDGAQKTVGGELESLLKKIKGRVESLSAEAGKLNYVYLTSDVFDKHISTINTYAKKLTDNLSSAFKRLKSKSDHLLSDVSEVSVIQAADNVYSAEAGVIEVVINAILKIDLEEQKWVKVQLFYDDPWQTPFLADNLCIKTNSIVHAEKINLNKSATKSTESETAIHAIESSEKQGGVTAFDDLKPNTEAVTVEMVGEPGIEKQIKDSRELIERRLDSVYVQVSKAMQPFAVEWQTRGVASLADGIDDGIVDWGKDFADMFSQDFWSSFGNTVWDAGASVLDTGAVYASEAIDNIQQSLEEQVKAGAGWYLSNTTKPVDELSLGDVADLFSKAIEDGAESIREMMLDNGARLKENLLEFYDDAEDAVERARLIAKYHEEIIALPRYIAENDAKALQTFIDTALKEIAPDWAKEIKDTGALPKAMAVMRDPSAAITYSAYVILLLDAIPPNFYTYYGGKLGIYVLLEVILNLILGFFTLGAGIAVRATSTAARLVVKGKYAKKLVGAKKALDTFGEALDEMGKIMGDLEGLADKLAKRKGGKIQGRPNMTLSKQVESKKRRGKCTVCKSSEHRTPKVYRGELERK